MSTLGQREGTPVPRPPSGPPGASGAGGDGAGTAADAPRGRSRPWRSIVFAPVGDGQTRRRGSDGLRVVAMVVAVVCCWLVTLGAASAQTEITKFLTSAPDGVKWLVNALWWLGSIGTIVVLAALALVSKRRNVARDIALAGGSAYIVCLVVALVVGPNGAHGPDPALAGVNLGFPLARVAATVAVGTAALPYLSRTFQRLVELVIAVAAVATVVHGSGLPVSVIASLAIGWGMTAIVHLIFGSPLGLPSGDEVAVLVRELGVTAELVVPSRRQIWGVARFKGRDESGPIDVSVYGRDAHDAQLLAKIFRYVCYRDSGPTLTLTRIQQVEHEAFLTLLAGGSGARVPEVAAAGRAGPAHDALLVTRPPAGTRLCDLPAPERPAAPGPGAAAPAGTGGDPTLGATGGTVLASGARHEAVTAAPGDGAPGPGSAEGSGRRGAPRAKRDGRRAARRARRAAEDAESAQRAAEAAAAAVAPRISAEAFSDEAADDLLRQIVMLRGASIAHGAISAETVVAGPGSEVGLVDFRDATVSGRDERLERDLAAALVTVGQATGPERAIAAAARVLPPDALAAALPFIQRAALDPVASKELHGRKPLLAALREQGAAAAGVEVPKLAEPRRISWVTLAMVIGSLIGGWALLLVLINVGKSWDTITGADWGWVAGCFLLAQAVYPAIAVTTVGSIVDPLPFGRVLALEVANTFVALAGGSMAVLATRVRFFQQDGYDATLAISSGAVCSTASWIVKGGLFLIALPFAISHLHFQSQSGSSGGSDNGLIWLILVAVVAVVVLAGLVLLVPRLRRLTRDKLRPKLSEVWAHLKVLAVHPRNLVEIFGGAVVAQILVAMALGAALHAFGDHLSLAILVVVLTLGSMLGGISPVPGGMGVVEAGMILGLTAAGISESDAVAAVFVQRLFTAYLPPIWGWFVLVWLRKKEYL